MRLQLHPPCRHLSRSWLEPGSALATRTLLVLLAVWLLVQVLPVQAQVQASTNAERLEWWNREIVTFRATVADAAPRARAERARQHLHTVPELEMDGNIHFERFTYQGQAGIQFLIGDRPLFPIVESDMDVDQRFKGLDAMANDIVRRLELARSAWQESRSANVLMIGVAKTLAILTVGGLLISVIGRARRYFSGFLERRRSMRVQQSSQMDWIELLDRLASRLLIIVQWGFSLLIAYGVYEFVFSSFPLTVPIAQKSRQWLQEQLVWVGNGILMGLPDLVTVTIIIVVSRALSDLLGYFFDAVRSGRFYIPFLHPETITATQRIVLVMLWLVTVAICYPYLPGSETEAFRGLSVLAGLMLTVGASGIVTQGISGLVLIYSRALRQGDFVTAGGTEGVVIEVGTLAVKILNYRNEEITVPNAVLLSSPIHNYTRMAATQGTLISSKVTIGYDAPWRAVHELLTSAAVASGRFRSDPAPKVFQRSLSDFYVEYELVLAIDDPMNRIDALSDLHRHIQDAFNRAGLQIMSPHFAFQPHEPVVIPETDWKRETDSALKSGVSSTR